MGLVDFVISGMELVDCVSSLHLWSALDRQSAITSVIVLSRNLDIVV